PAWFPPAPRRQAALALRPACAPGQRVFAPEDVGLYVNALTACHAYLAHSFSPEVAQRRAVVGAFYGGLSPAQRAVVLDALRVRHLVLPGDEGPVPSSWLGPQTPFRRLAVAGQGAGAMSVYSRAAPGER
ncbi:MAG TPA: hypothetical protein VFO85_10400, partial [Vicinamibacteria bacterium]|nr:hypothetical protein [Vicinamibacteria bacterium]